MPVLFIVFFHLVQFVFAERTDERIGFLINIGGFSARAGNDQGSPRLIDQDRVNLVDNGKMERALHQIFAARLHIVAQVVKPELAVGTVGDIGVICLLAFRRRHALYNQTGREPEKVVDAPHFLAVAAGKVFVDRDDMHALPGKRIEVRGERRNERLPLTCFHLGDPALMEHDAAEQLHVVRSLSEDTRIRLPDDRESVRQNIVDRLAVLKSFF